MDKVLGEMISPPGFIIPFIKAIRKKRWRVMYDLGCGVGFYAPIFRIHCCHPEGSEIHGCDLNTNMTLFREWYSSIKHSDVNRFIKEIGPYIEPDAFFNCLELIEHLPVDDGKRMLEALAKKGREVLLSTPAEPFPMQSEFVGLSHRSSWTADMIMSCGFNMDYQKEMRDPIYGTKHLFLILNPLEDFRSPTASMTEQLKGGSPYIAG